jgi:Protein of unknown function (DUF3182)
MARINQVGASHGTVVLHATNRRDDAHGHEWVTCTGIAKKLAALKGFAFAGEYRPGSHYPGPVYFVPRQTLAGIAAANALGIQGEDDLFGGVVPALVVATKAITRPLVAPDARAHCGWSHDFAARVRELGHNGFSVFTLDDAQRAGARLLERGPARIKPVHETGGRGQIVVHDHAELNRALERLAADVATSGLVIEENLANVTTYSVGRVRVAELVASYYGTQRLTRDNGGAAVYGGSALILARGEFEVLLGREMPADARLAVERARAFDVAALECFPDLFASRRNYDVAYGLDSAGQPCCSVLEQSWRIGGASGAEVAALEAFRAEPALQTVRASCFEIYGESEPPPAHATVYFRGVDPRVGPLTKYTVVEDHGDAR